MNKINLFKKGYLTILPQTWSLEDSVLRRCLQCTLYMVKNPHWIWSEKTTRKCNLWHHSLIVETKTQPTWQKNPSSFFTFYKCTYILDVNVKNLTDCINVTYIYDMGHLMDYIQLFNAGFGPPRVSTLKFSEICRSSFAVLLTTIYTFVKVPTFTVPGNENGIS